MSQTITDLMKRLMDSTWNAYYGRVIKFNHDGGNACGQAWLTQPKAEVELRLIKEEVDELEMALKGMKKVKLNGQTEWIEAAEQERRAEVADALGDIIYVALGTAGKLGIDLPRVLDEIAASNESKYNTEGKLDMVNGKIQKGSHFKAPDLSFVNDVINFDEMFK